MNDILPARIWPVMGRKFPSQGMGLDRPVGGHTVVLEAEPRLPLIVGPRPPMEPEPA